MIDDQGEIALVLEHVDGECKIVGYTLPKQGETFQPDEVRNAFLVQSMGNPVFEDSDREVLSKYLDSATLPVSHCKTHGA